MKSFARSDRVGDAIREELSMALLTDARDPRLRKLSITAVDVTPCLQSARVFWVPLDSAGTDDRELQRMQRALDRAGGYLRTIIASKITLRVVPELHFLHDESIERGRRMEELLDELREERGDESADDDEDA